MLPAGDIEVSNSIENPTDSIAHIAWSNLSSKFAVSSWDSSIRIFSVDQSNSSKYFLKSEMILGMDDPCLSLSWNQDDSKIYAGCINNSLYSIDPYEQKSTIIGDHTGPVRDVYWLNHLGLVASLSYDQTLKFWDPKSPSNALSSISLNFKPICSAFVFPTLAIAMSSEKLLFLNLSKLDTVINYANDYKSSPLGDGSIITSIDLFTNGYGIGVGSQDGRGNLSHLSFKNERYELSNIMTFKAQKVEKGGVGHLYLVNSMGFNKRYDQSVFTAGGEGNLNFWDYQAKNKVKQLNFGVPITYAKVDPTGMMIAYGLGYDYSAGIEKYQSFKPKIGVHLIQDNEIKYNKP